MKTHSYLYHLSTDALDFSAGDIQAATLGHDAFIHLCTAGQVDAVRKRFFADAAVLYVTTLRTEELSDVRFEDTYGHGSYPHLYGGLPKRAVVKTERL